MKLLFASRNQGKTAEINRLLQDSGWRVMSLSGIGGEIELVEDGLTFEANARMKAREAARMFKMWTLADDSGLEIDALGGDPGVLSARYAGPNATDADRIKLVLDRMIAVPDGGRNARFRCVMCLVNPEGKEKLFEGKVEGSISHHPRGTAGFGYDPIFIPDSASRTFAELGLEAKNRLSHRAAAMAEVLKHLESEVPQVRPDRRYDRGGGSGRFDIRIPGDFLT